MMILALDTSVGISVALHDGVSTIADITIDEYGIQGEQAVALIDQVLKQANLTPADVTDVVVGVGPGPFTGLRVGVAIAQVFAAARKIPIRGICSLDAIAHSVGGNCVVVTNARRKELYWARYSTIRMTEPAVNLPTDLVTEFSNDRIVGPAAGLYSEFVSGEVVPLHARYLAELAASGSAQFVPVVPMYLRKPDAEEPTGRKPVLT